MAFFFEEPSHTFDEYLLIPGYTSADCIPANVSLQTPVVRYNKKAGEKCPLTMNIPMVSAVMQSVSNDKLATALARSTFTLPLLNSTKQYLTLTSICFALKQKQCQQLLQVLTLSLYCHSISNTRNQMNSLSTWLATSSFFLWKKATSIR